MRVVRLIMMLIIAALSVFSYCTERTVNPITGEKQHVGLTPEQEVAMGVQVAPEMARRFGGIDRDERLRQTVKAVGEKIVAQSIAAQSGYPFVFRVLADDQTVNASYEMAQVAQLVGGLIHMKYGREDEIEADKLGLCLINQAGYRPAALVDVMRILAEAGGVSPLPEFASTHPHPKNRAKKIQTYIEDLSGTCASGLAPPSP